MLCAARASWAHCRDGAGEEPGAVHAGHRLYMGHQILEAVPLRCRRGWELDTQDTSRGLTYPTTPADRDHTASRT